MTVVMSWLTPRWIRESRAARERLDKQTETILEQTYRSSEVTLRAASRLELAAATLMERHNQALIDAAEELHRK